MSEQPSLIKKKLMLHPPKAPNKSGFVGKLRNETTSPEDFYERDPKDNTFSSDKEINQNEKSPEARARIAKNDKSRK